MLITYWEGFLIFCGIISALDLWLRYGSKVTRFIQNLKPERKPKPIKEIKKLYMAVWVEIDSKTHKACIVQQFGSKIERSNVYSKVGADLDCPIRTARAISNLLGLRPDGNNRWSNDHAAI